MLTTKNKKLTAERDFLNDRLNASQKQVEALEQSQQVLKNEKAGLTNKNTMLKSEKTELTEKIKALATERDRLIASHQEKSDLDLHNRRLASANQDLKRQNRKLEEENIALKERVDGLKEQLFTLQPQKPQ
ncbi:hypothetical protein [Helicobacter pylori]|uniref:hypothetical protein n=1 Tax=Helicobacter pylori TaxID=210 RepID=UPI0039DFDC2F